MDIRRTFTTPTKNSYASDYIKNKRSKVLFSGTSNLANTIVEQKGMFPLVTSSGHLKPYQGTFGFSSATQTSGAPPSSYCLNTARSYHDLLDITRGKYLLTPPNATTTIIQQLSDINFSTQLFCGSLYQNGNTGVAQSIIFNNSISGGATGPTGASNKIIYNPATTANQWIKVDPSYNLLNNGNSCESENNSVLNNATVRTNIQAQRKLDRYLNLDVQGFKFPVKFSMYYDPSDCINSNNDLQLVENELLFTSPDINKLITVSSFNITNFVFTNSTAPVVYTSSNPNVATIVDNIVTIVGLGTTTIVANQPVSINRIHPAGRATAQLTVSLVPVSLSNFKVDARYFGSGSFDLDPPTSNSPGLFTYESSNTDVATILGKTVTIVGAGTTTITARQAAITNYTAGVITASFVVNPIAPTFGAFTITSKDFGSVPFALGQPTSNNILGAFSYESSNTGVATISDKTVTIVGAGTTNITATQSATRNYTLKSITVPFVVNPIAPTFGTFAIASRNFGNQPFSILQNTHTVLYVRTGGSDWQTRIINNDTSNANLTWWNPDMQWYRLDVAPQNEIALQFRFFAAYVTTFYNITAASSTVVSSAGNIGTYSFTFNGGANYTGIFNGQIQQWNYTLPVAVNRNSSFALEQPTSNNILGAFIYESSNTGVATISGNIVTTVGAGTTNITATQSATTNYTLKGMTVPFIVNPIVPIFGAFTIASRSFGTQSFSILQNTHTVLYIRFGSTDWQTRIINNDTSNANLQGWNPDQQWYRPDIASQNEIALQFRFFAAYVTTLYNITSASCTVVSSNGNIGTYSFMFNGGINYTGIFNSSTPVVWDYTLPVAVNRNSLQPISNSPGLFTYESSNTGVATISGNTVTVVGGGSTTITARQAAITNYTAGAITAPFVVIPVAPVLSNFTVNTKSVGSVPFDLTRPDSTSSGAFTYESSNLSVATISGSTVTIVGAGTTTITARQAATTNHIAGTITALFTVN